MSNKKTFADYILQFNRELYLYEFVLPKKYSIINPFTGPQKEKISFISTKFYKKFYNDTVPRRLILGSSPARRGSAVTGIPFEDSMHLEKITGIKINDFLINKSSSDFLYQVISEFGGFDAFYARFYMNFVCPLGIVRTNEKGNEVNCNYYETKSLKEALRPFIISSIRKQISFGLDTSICYCIGSGENFKFLEEINAEYSFFNKIIPLEHPRYITQYNSKNKTFYMQKYIDAFNRKS